MKDVLNLSLSLSRALYNVCVCCVGSVGKEMGLKWRRNGSKRVKSRLHRGHDRSWAAMTDHGPKAKCTGRIYMTGHDTMTDHGLKSKCTVCNLVITSRSELRFG